MADLWRLEGEQQFDNSGNPLNGGKFYFYDAGTSSARTVYQDDGAATPWTQPIELDANGRLTASIYIPTGDFKEKLTTSADVEIYTEDNIPGAVTIPSSTYASPDTPVISKTSDYTITASDQGKWIKTDTTGGSVQLTLPSATTAGDGFIVFIQHTVAANVTTIVRAGSDTLNGGSSLRIFRQWGTVVVVSDGGTAWTAMSAEFYFATLAKTANYTVLPSDVGKLLTGDATSAGFTFTLPAAATAGDGFTVGFLKIDSTANALTLDGDSAETINGAANYVLYHQWQSVRLRCNGSAWYVVDARGGLPITANFIIDGVGAALATGVAGDLGPFDFVGKIQAVTLLADQSGSVVIDIWKDTFANFPPTDADTITASAPPTISTATNSQDTTLTGWTTAIAVGDILRFNVDSVTSITRVTVGLKIVRGT